jgi:hypothetical protein
MAGRDALVTLLHHTSGRQLLTRAETTRLEQLYARLVADVPVCILRDLESFDYSVADFACKAS